MEADLLTGLFEDFVINTLCPFSTFGLMNMQHQPFLPGCAKHWEEKVQICEFGTSTVIYKT